MFSDIASTQPDIEKQHQNEPDCETERRPVLMAAAMGFGDDFVADDVEHRPGGEGEAPWQQRLRDADDPSPKKPAYRLDKTCQGGNAPRTAPGISLTKQ